MGRGKREKIKKENGDVQAGISTASLFLKKPNEEAAALLSEWGVPVAEVFLSTFSEYDRAFGAQIARNKGSLRVNSVHTLTEQYEPQLYGAYERVRKDAFAVLGGVMEAAREMGARYYTFHGVARIKRTGNYDNFSFLSPRTREISEFCARYGVTLAFENVEWATYNRPGVFRELQRECPALKGVLDVKQARISGYDYKAYIADMGPALAYVHFSDADADGVTCLPGRGCFDLEEMLRCLCGSGFDGAVLIENYARDYADLSALKESWLWLQEKIYKFTR